MTFSLSLSYIAWYWTLDIEPLILSLDIDPWYWTLILTLTWTLDYDLTTCTWHWTMNPWPISILPRSYLLWSSHNHSIDAPMLCTLVWLERCTTPSLILVIYCCYNYYDYCYWPAGAYGCILDLSWLVLGYGHLDYDMDYMIYITWWLGMCALQPLTSWELITPSWDTWLEILDLIFVCLGVKYW